MIQPIRISNINDFIFCPHSIYLHGIYESFSKEVYHDTPQKAGSLSHERIDEHTYSSAKRYLQGIPIYSSSYNLVGKIDIYDRTTQTLIERKHHLKQIFDGHRYQLYAQMACMQEMGHTITALKIHSITDNKRHTIPIPNKQEWQQFTDTLQAMQRYQPSDDISTNENKCANCIYYQLCDKAAC